MARPAPTHEQNRGLYEWLLNHRDVLTGDSFFHLSAYGQPMDGLNLCGAGRIVCCVDPVGEVYACPFMLAPSFPAATCANRAGSPASGATHRCSRICGEWQVGGSCQSCNAYDQCHGGCMAVKHFTQQSLDAPDPDCVFQRPASFSNTGQGRVATGEHRIAMNSIRAIPEIRSV